MAGNSAIRIGILGLQGGVREHCTMLERLNVTPEVVRKPQQLSQVSGLILPGGESSVIDKLARLYGLQKPIQEAIAQGLPVMGTCAGLILLANDIQDALEGQQTFGGLDVTVRRNAFGSQIESFETDLPFVRPEDSMFRAVFIRAPLIERVGASVIVRNRLEDGKCVAVEQGSLLGLSFHPEMVKDTRWHEYFLDMVKRF